MLNYPHTLDGRRIVPDTAWPWGYADQPDISVPPYREPAPIGIVMMMSRPVRTAPPRVRVFEQPRRIEDRGDLQANPQLQRPMMIERGVERGAWQDSRESEPTHVQAQQELQAERQFHAPPLQQYAGYPVPYYHALAPQMRARRGSTLQRLLPKSGLKRSVCLGDFRQQLLPQLAQPERLRNSHRLMCSVQVHRLTIAQHTGAITRKLFGAAADANQLLPLTASVAQQLRLPSQLQNAAADVQVGDVDLLPAGTCIVQLTVLHDHTQDAPSEPQPRNAPQETIAQAPKSIPEQFLKPWDFQLSREAALFDMGAASSSGLWARFNRLVRSVGRRSEFRRWRALLSGSLDEQLWTVRPPRGSLADPIVREWAERTLARAGYDTAGMPREWELYWRRKGV